MTANSVATAARVADPCCFVIFGASGDLTRRLLVPALYNLAAAGLLADGFSVIGVGRLRLHTILTPGHTPGSMCFRNASISSRAKESDARP